MGVQTTTLAHEVRAFEAQFTAAQPNVQEAIVGTVTTLIGALGAGANAVPPEMLGDLMNLLTNISGKLNKGLLSEVQLLALLEAQAPTLSARIRKEAGF